jgi:thymidine phosphorylase
LTDDTAAIGNGIANPAQTVLDVHSTMGTHLPHSLLIAAFATALGKAAVPAAARALAKQSGIPMSHVMTFSYQATYSHNDPAGAYPKNAFFSNLVKFLNKIA